MMRFSSIGTPWNIKRFGKEHGCGMLRDPNHREPRLFGRPPTRILGRLGDPALHGGFAETLIAVEQKGL